jgi:peptidoglycan/LPS O-acetylase OafA/YrhL
MKYRPEIDGLRAVAVIPVILFHGGFKAFAGGFIGVDVFFVISGFLITSLIVSEAEAGQFSFLGFYERRARRILPALFLVMASCIPFAWMWMFPLDFAEFSRSVMAVCAFASNILFWRQSGYFDTAAELKPLLHTWSLAVEEQYYIIFPIVILLLWRLGRRNVILTIAIVAALSLALSQYASRYHSSANFYLLPTRAWELMAGALSSFAAITINRRRDNILSALGLGAIALSVFAFDETIPMPSLYALLPVLGTCAVIVFARDGTLVRSLLSARPVVGVGLISYSAYLWHQPLFAFARIRSMTEPSWQFMLLLSTVSLALAYVSWRFVEIPARKRNAWPLPNRRTVFTACAIAAVVFLAGGLAGNLTNGFPERMPTEMVTLAQFSNDKNPRMDECHSAPLNRTCIYGNQDRAPIAILGDSHATSLAFQLGNALDAEGLGLLELTNTSCPPIHRFYLREPVDFAHCGPRFEPVLGYLKTHPNITTVVLFARWTGYIEFTGYNNGEGGVESWLVKGGVEGIDPSNVEALQREIGKLYQQSVRELVAMGKRVVLVYPMPEAGWDVPHQVAKAALYGEKDKRPLSTSYDRFKQRSRRAYEALDGIGENGSLIRIHPEKIFCDTLVKNRCLIEDGKVPFYFDDDHVDSVGAAMISRAIVDAMRAKGWMDAAKAEGLITLQQSAPRHSIQTLKEQSESAFAR